jgi:hypothetical protein
VAAGVRVGAREVETAVGVVGALGVGVGLGVRLGVLVGRGVRVGVRVGVFVGLGVGLALVGEGEGDGATVSVASGTAATTVAAPRDVGVGPLPRFAQGFTMAVIAINPAASASTPPPTTQAHAGTGLRRAGGTGCAAGIARMES